MMLGERIRQRRQQLGLTLSEAARRAGLSRQALLAIEQGRVPRADTAVRLANVLGTTVEALYGPDDQAVWVGPRRHWARWATPRGLVLYGVEGFQADVRMADGSPVPLPQARPPDRVVVVAGCDPALPLIADWMPRLYPGWWCDVWACTSAEALRLFREGLVHVAGIHLFHPQGYNRPWADNIAGSIGVHTVTWASGLAAREARDLDRWPDHWRNGTMVLRQPGSEARALAERTAKAAGLPAPAQPAPEASSHLEAARWVAEGRGTVAVVTAAAAAAYDLEFRPWADEPFDWIVPANPGPGVERLLGLLGHPAVRESLARVPGYDVTQCGQPAWGSRR
jgi:transcriptional regulator with XRE-family HTH domain/molybdate-binding protein